MYIVYIIYITLYTDDISNFQVGVKVAHIIKGSE